MIKIASYFIMRLNWIESIFLWELISIVLHIKILLWFNKVTRIFFSLWIILFQNCRAMPCFKGESFKCQKCANPPNKQKAFIQWWVGVGPSSSTLAQHQPIIGLKSHRQCGVGIFPFTFSAHLVNRMCCQTLHPRLYCGAVKFWAGGRF